MQPKQSTVIEEEKANDFILIEHKKVEIKEEKDE